MSLLFLVLRGLLTPSGGTTNQFGRRECDGLRYPLLMESLLKGAQSI